MQSSRKCRLWTTKEVDYLKKWYHRGKSAEDISKILNRSKHAVINKVSLLGLSKERNNPYKWSPNEEFDLTFNWVCCTKQELKKLLPRHSWRSILWKANQLGLKSKEAFDRNFRPYSKEEEETILKHYKVDMTAEELEVLLGRTAGGIRNKYAELNKRKSSSKGSLAKR